MVFSTNHKVNGMGLVCGGAMEAYDSCSNVPGDIGAKDCKSNLERTTTKGNTIWATAIFLGDIEWSIDDHHQPGR